MLHIQYILLHSGFLRVLRFPPPIKLTATIYNVAEILLKVALNIINPKPLLYIFLIFQRKLNFYQGILFFFESAYMIFLVALYNNVFFSQYINALWSLLD